MRGKKSRIWHQKLAEVEAALDGDVVEFLPISQVTTLIQLRKTDCLFCKNKAIQVAHRKTSYIRCCDEKQCKERAETMCWLFL